MHAAHGASRRNEECCKVAHTGGVIAASSEGRPGQGGKEDELRGSSGDGCSSVLGQMMSQLNASVLGLEGRPT